MAFPNNSIPVTNSIGLTAETDTFPTHLSNFGKGGLHSVGTLAELYAITTERRLFGMECNVTSEVGFTGKYKLSNLAMGGVDNDLTNNNNWKIETIASTGDYYVHFTTGKDLAGAGSVINPFKTIQYAIANVPAGKRIKILQDNYLFTGSEKLHYNGTIELQGAIINVDIDFNEYLIDNPTKIDITGTGIIQMITSNSKFLRQTDNTYCKIEGINVLFEKFTEGPVEISGDGITQFKNCQFNRYPNNTNGFINFFASDNLTGRDFSFIGCGFNGLKLKFRNYSSNGGATIKDCYFYGTSSFGSVGNYLEIGQSNDVGRILLIENTTFDMVSMGASPNTAIIVYNDYTRITMRNVRFVRYSQPNRSCISTTSDSVTIYAFNVVTYTPVSDGSPNHNLTILPAGEFKYFDNLPYWVR